MNILLKNILAVILSGEGLKAEKCDIEISGENITAVLPAGEKSEFKADRVINGESKLAIPGLINSHTHSYMSVFRNCADDLPFHDWLFGRILPMEDKLTENDMYYGTLLGCLEMIKTGTTGYIDMIIAKDCSSKAAVDSGMKAVVTRGLVGFGKNDEGGIRRINEAIYDKEKYTTDKVRHMMGPHTIYTTDREYLELVMKAADEQKIGINIHLSESTKEIGDCLKAYRMTPPEYLKAIGMFDFHTVLAHCVQLSDSDIELLASSGAYIATNPISNAKLANGIARIPDMQNAGCRLCIGTDSAASNNTLNMFSDMNMLALLHKASRRSATDVTAEEIVKMATIGGARAMGLNDTGAIEAGKKADIAILDLNFPSMQPINDVIAALCYSASGYEVESVMVNGEFLMENRELKTIDEERVYFEANKTIERIR